MFRVVLLLLLAVLVPLSRPGTLRAQSVPDTNAILQHVVASQLRFQQQWTIAWIQSESERRALLNTLEASAVIGRRTLADGSVELRHTSRGFLYDSTVLTAIKPVYRYANVACSPLDRPGGLDGRGKSGEELAQRSPSIRYALGRPTIIQSQITGFSVCPSWYLGPESLPQWDERLGIDRALSTHRVRNITHARTQLIGVLDSALTRLSSHRWLLGQSVRLLVDQELPDRALALLRHCAAGDWWCQALTGYIRNVKGEPAEAERSFRTALENMPVTVRCRWTDLSTLLDSSFSAVYRRLSCTERDSLNAYIWWLADPMWTEDGNERFAEHFARRVLLELRTALPNDERFDWREEVGSDARAEMVLRYGWPSFVYWRGPSTDSVRSQELSHHPAASGGASPANPPYVSYEYSAGRTHLFPSSRALFAAHMAKADDWSLRAPPGGDTVVHFELPHRIRANDPPGAQRRLYQENSIASAKWINTDYPRYVDSIFWWPMEHFASASVLVQFADPQVALLRREDHALLAVAVECRTETNCAVGANSQDVALVVTPTPDSIAIVARKTAVLGASIVVKAAVPARNAMVGLESRKRGGVIATRTRFGLTVPSALSEMKVGEVAISEPILLRLPDGEYRIPVDTDSALSLLAPSPAIERGKAIGLYWETYGFTPTDDVSISVRVLRRARTSAIRNLGMALNLLSDPNTPVSVVWSESQVHGGSRTVLAGRIPVIGRSVTLNLSRLQVGEYQVDIVVRNSDGRTVQSSKAIHVR
jgi:hypothetical protein